jgi:glycosyltransferase involved in cell wall biosynthesis
MVSMVVIFIPSLFGGGAERVALLFAQYLSMNKTHVRIVYLHGDSDSISSNSYCNFIKLKSKSVFKSFFQFSSTISDLNPDVVFAFTDHNIIVASISRLVYRYKYRLIGSQRATLSLNNRFIYRFLGLYFLLIRFAYKNCNLLHSVSEGVRNDLHQTLHLPLINSIVISNPVPIDEVKRLSLHQSNLLSKFSEKEALFITVGRLAPVKDHLTLIRAFEIYRINNQGTLLIIGDGPMKESLRQYAIKTKCGNDIHFLGYQSNPYIFIKACDLFILSSKNEGNPNALLEALVIGASVVSSDCQSGPSELLVGNLSDRLFPVGDYSALAEKMFKFKANYKDISNFNSENYNTHHIFKKYSQLLYK